MARARCFTKKRQGGAKVKSSSLKRTFRRSTKKRSASAMKKIALYASITTMAKTTYDKELVKKYEDMSLPQLEELLEEVDGDYADAQNQDENTTLLKEMIKYKKL